MAPIRAYGATGLLRAAFAERSSVDDPAGILLCCDSCDVVMETCRTLWILLCLMFMCSLLQRAPGLVSDVLLSSVIFFIH